MKRSVRSFIILVLIGVSTLSFAGFIPNFSKVDEGIYRGGQPKESDFTYLKDLGVKTVIDLRNEKDAIDWERALCEKYNMRFINIPLVSEAGIAEGELKKFLESIDKKNRPVFVHCFHGANRAGALIAAYRIICCGWPVDKAYKEALSFGFYRLHTKLKKFILEDAARYKETLDKIETLH